MPRTQQSRKRHSKSSSFTKFVARLQRTFSTKNMKASTPVVPQELLHRSNPNPIIPTFPSFTNLNYPRCRLSQILYDPSRQIEYLSEIEEKTNSDLSEQSLSVDENDSCYDSMSDHRTDRFNLSQMNVSMNPFDYDPQREQQHYPSKKIKPKLPNSFDTARFHSTAIHDIGHF